MATSEVFNIAEPVYEDTGIARYDVFRYEPQNGVSLNTDSGMIQFDMFQSNSYQLPSRAYLQFEGRLTKADGTAWLDTDNVTLVNNAMMYLFRSMKLMINSTTIEEVSYPGQITSMMGYLKYSDDFQKAQGLNQLWYKDTSTTAAIDTNTGFAVRQAYIIQSPTNKGTFQFCVPLSHIFGFCEDYTKVIYGYRMFLQLVRNTDNDAIFRGVTAPADVAGKVTLNNIYLYMPYLIPDIVPKAELERMRASSESAVMGFRNRYGYRIGVDAGSTSWTWNVDIKGGKATPRYVLLAFQTAKEADQTKNPALFDNLAVTRPKLFLNNTYYPQYDYDLNFADNKFSRSYLDAATFTEYFYQMSELAAQSNISPADFKSLFTIFAWDVSNQEIMSDNTSVKLSIEINTSANIPQNTVAYALVINDRNVLLKMNGTGVSVVN